MILLFMGDGAGAAKRPHRAPVTVPTTLRLRLRCVVGLFLRRRHRLRLRRHGLRFGRHRLCGSVEQSVRGFVPT